MRRMWHGIAIFLVLALLVLSETEAKSKRKKGKKDAPETTLFNFLRLFVFRLIYGFASAIGVEEGLSEFMGGILVPPGVDDDYGDSFDADDLEY